MTPVFYINLARDTERRAHMEGELACHALTATRVEGVDGAAVPLPDPRIDHSAFRARHHAHLRPGEIGCYLSHVAALRAFLASGSPMGMILEDDAVLGPDVCGALRSLSCCPEHWDLVKLYATHPSGIIHRVRLANGLKLASLLFRHASSAAYVVNRKAASALVNGLYPMTVPYDHEFDRGWKYGLKVRAVLPFPVSRKTFPSSVGESNKKNHKPWYQLGGMIAFRGGNDIARVWHELRQT